MPYACPAICHPISVRLAWPARATEHPYNGRANKDTMRNPFFQGMAIPPRLRAAVVFGLTIRRHMRLVLQHSLARVRPVTPLSRLEHKNDDQRREDDEKGYGARQRSKHIDIRFRHGRRQALQLERQGVDGSDRLAGAREFVPRQGKAEQTNAHDGRQYDWQHYMAKCLPWCCTEVARRLFKPPCALCVH